jgi:hypothetical protein
MAGGCDETDRRDALFSRAIGAVSSPETESACLSSPVAPMQSIRLTRLRSSVKKLTDRGGCSTSCFRKILQLPLDEQLVFGSPESEVKHCFELFLLVRMLLQEVVELWHRLSFMDREVRIRHNEYVNSKPLTSPRVLPTPDALVTNCCSRASSSSCTREGLAGSGASATGSTCDSAEGTASTGIPLSSLPEGCDSLTTFAKH